MKPLTRREVRAWFDPIRRVFNELKTGEVESINDIAVTRLDKDDSYTPIVWCIAGWLGCLRRLFPDADLSAMEKIHKSIDNEGVAIDDVDSALRLLNQCETMMIKIDRQAVKDAVLTEQIQIEMDSQEI